MAVKTIEKNIELYKCPICGGKMHLYQLKSIICQKNHCFDIAKTGYVNLLLKPPKSQYDKTLFKSRKTISEMGFFDPLIDSIAAVIEEKFFQNKGTKDLFKILDAGCGDGFHLSQITKKLIEKKQTPIQGVGIDISKDGIQIASRNYKGILWSVANLAEIPFRDHQFDVILNILSPFNYQEFSRVIKKDGILIKVLPGDDYLKELRKILFKETKGEDYSNKETIEHFSQNYKIIHRQKINYEISLNQEELRHLIKMTPLTWNLEQDRQNRVLKEGINKITAQFKLLIGV